MSATRTEFPSTEGILLMRQNGVTMAVHLSSITAILEAVITEPDIPLADVWVARPPKLDHYAVEATGRADRIYVWKGADPFSKDEIQNPRAEVEA